ncbi:hypothetical protein DUNSADRAFT_3028 [Dunaliella salina]|uniref:Damage-control phosphatase ARMT1-like metal-binding domain-containing protein n=1 Tax=Dunaliella salina TaxID=3046 RepID=A0ABQ7FVS6_DUNSA|nr:hypothetical protein DUNSADRAFT_3028 [Dunaliella salina]|eukprot:KAF5826462.1 hypothetical protein DUNSADRAFT_3028 [Dunaliella salina]
MRLPQIKDDYDPCTFIYKPTPEDNAVTALQWIEVFRASTPTFAKYALQDETVPAESRTACVTEFERAFHQALDALAAEHGSTQRSQEPLNCIILCQVREDCLKKAGFGDIFRRVKRDENAAALAVLPGVLKNLDGCSDTSERLELALRGVLAGNIFDLGASTSAALFDRDGAAASFVSTRTKLLPRPWVIDDLDTSVQRLALAGTTGQYKKAMLFVDNAGSDVVLGMLPFARELLRLGMKVVLAANRGPTINDITAEELQAVVQEAARLDNSFRQASQEGKLAVVSSGSDLPVIDLRLLSQEVVDCAQDVDLVILEGMGRSIETNLNAGLRCDSMRIGMVKHPEVATCLKGRLLDCVCKFIPGSA